MNQKIKYLAMFAILPLFAVTLMPNFISTAEATHPPGTENNGTSKLVCDDKLCSEIEDGEDKNSITIQDPLVKQSTIHA